MNIGAKTKFFYAKNPDIFVSSLIFSFEFRKLPFKYFSTFHRFFCLNWCIFKNNKFLHFFQVTYFNFYQSKHFPGVIRVANNNVRLDQFSRFYVYWIQANIHTPRQTCKVYFHIYIYYINTHYMPPYIQIYFCKHATIQETQTIALSMVYTPIHQTGHIHTNHHIPLSIFIPIIIFLYPYPFKV